MSGVADNANNFKRPVFRFLGVINDDVLAECVSSVEKFFDEGFVHHHDRHPLSAVAMVKSAAGQKWDVHRAKVIAHYREMRRIRMVAGTGVGPARDPKRRGSIVTGKRQWRHSPDSFDAGKGTQPIIEPFEEFVLLQWQICIFRPRQGQIDGQHPRWFKSRICCPQITEAFDQQSRAGWSNIDNATCAMTKRARARCDSRPTAPRLPSCRHSFTFGRETCRAGKTAKSKVLTTAAISVKTMTSPLIWISSRRGTSRGPNTRKRSIPHHARRRPVHAPRNARTRPSVNNCVTMRRRLAPSAVRIAISRRRWFARASNKFATLAQAMSKTRNTAETIVSKAGRTSPTRSW